MSALLFLDSFDHYSTSQAHRKWTTGTPNAINSANGRTGNGANIGTFGNISKTLGQEYLTMACGMAYKTQGYGQDPIAFASDIGLSASFGTNGDGRYFFECAAGSTAPSTFVLNIGEWYYIELYVTVTITTIDANHFTAAYDGLIRVNENTIASGSFSHTVTYSGSTTGRGFSQLHLTGSGGSSNSSVDDLYLTDGELLGDVKIGVLYPNAAGDSAGWTPNAAGANYTKVMEHSADDDTTYNSAGTTGLKDLYNLDNIDPAFTGTIKGVQALWCVKKSDEGSASVKGVWKSGSTEITQSSGLNYVAPNGYPPSATDYLYSIEPERKSLFTMADWTMAEIDALQLGITRTV